MILTHGGVFMMIFDSLKDVFYAFDPLEILLMLCVLCLLRAFLSFLDVFLNFPFHF